MVLDNDHANWDAFANRYWPAKYLVDRKGEIVYSHFGEGAYAETEREIQKALSKGRADGALPEIAPEEHAHGSVCFVPTAETYCGYERGHLANEELYQENLEAEYHWDGELPDDAIALDGRFFVAAEYVESRLPRQSAGGEGASLLLRFRATEVNLVMRPAGDEEARVSITLNDETPDPAVRGRDVDDNGDVVIRESNLYNLLKSESLIEGTLRIQAKEENFQAYAFTFSGCEEPEK